LISIPRAASVAAAAAPNSQEATMLKPTRYRVQNFRNIDDSDWMPLERVTALVGRNESGKTALLKVLHKFNPAIPEPYNAQREFPRDRFNRDFKNAADWPVCSVAFEIADPLRGELEGLLDGAAPPKEAIFTRYYDGHLTISFEPPIVEKPVSPGPAVQALKTLAAAAPPIRPCPGARRADPEASHRPCGVGLSGAGEAKRLHRSSE
jgi:hypothetical protein